MNFLNAYKKLLEKLMKINRQKHKISKKIDENKNFYLIFFLVEFIASFFCDKIYKIYNLLNKI